jgi:hypothetical protein
VKPKWDNLFWYQRAGGNNKKQLEKASENKKEQLENNTTKGFLKLLQESDDRVTSGFLANCLGVSIDEAVFEYDVQKGVDDISTVESEIHLVGLSYDGRNVAKEASPRSDGGIVDGIITAQTDSATTKFVIEVKTGRDQLGHQQMGRYRESLNISDDDHCHGVRWFEVFELLENQRHQEQKNKDRFLLREYTDYLELMNMIPFRGFDREELQKPDNTEYKRSLMRGVKQQKPGAFAEALDKNTSDYDLDGFIPVSNHSSTQIHMIDQEAYQENKSFRNVNHFTAGFWDSNFNLQLNVQNRILDKVTKQKKKNSDGKQPEETFIKVMNQTLHGLEDTRLTLEWNPLVHVRYQQNLQQENSGPYQTSAFDIDVFSYSSKMTDDEGLEQKISNLARAVREARSTDIGNERSLVIEKQIPRSWEVIGEAELVDYTLEFFNSLIPVYEYFDR